MNKLTGDNVSYDPIRSQLNAGTIQDAIDNLANSSMLMKSINNVDLDDFFADGIYVYGVSCSNAPTSNEMGTLIVLVTSAKHVTQIAIPSISVNSKTFDFYVRHYRQVTDGEYGWSVWYRSKFVKDNENTVDDSVFYREELSNVPNTYNNSYILRFQGSSINPSNFPNSSFIVSLQTDASTNSASLWSVIYSDSTWVSQRLDGSSSSNYPQLGFTNTGNLYVKMSSSSSTLVNTFVTKTR